MDLTYILPGDVFPFIFHHLNDNIVHLISLLHVNRFFHTSVSHYGQMQEFDRRQNCGYAVKTGNFALLQWARDIIMLPWDHSTLIEAVKINRIDMVVWLKDHGCPINSRVSDHAALTGHLAILQYLHQQGLPLNHRTMDCAIRSRSLEVVKWLNEQECPISCSFSNDVSKYGTVEIVQWLQDIGFPLSGDNRFTSFTSRSGSGK